MTVKDKKYETNIVTPPADIIPNRQPRYIDRLANESGKDTNAVKVELDEQKRNAEFDLMKNPPNMMNVKDIQDTVDETAINKLHDIYANGGEEEEDDEATYDEMTEINTNPNDPFAVDFDMFPPAEQDLSDQINLDADAINAETPPQDPTNPTPLGMDELAEIAEPEDDLNLPEEEAPDLPD